MRLSLIIFTTLVATTLLISQWEIAQSDASTTPSKERHLKEEGESAETEGEISNAETETAPTKTAQSSNTKKEQKSGQKPQKSRPFSLKRIERNYQKSGSVQADFEQEVFQATLSRTKSSRGKLLISKPDKVRWEIYAPEKTVMVSNGRKLYYYSPDAGVDGKGQVIVRPAKLLARHAVIQILNGSIPMDREFKLKKVEKQAKGVRLVTVAPKKQLSDIEQVEMVVDGKSRIIGLTLQHHSGNRTKIRLKNLKLGDKLPTTLFEFKPPEGVEVLQE